MYEEMIYYKDIVEVKPGIANLLHIQPDKEGKFYIEFEDLEVKWVSYLKSKCVIKNGIVKFNNEPYLKARLKQQSFSEANAICLVYTFIIDEINS